MRSRSRGVLRRDELLDLQRSSGGDPGERGSGLLLSLPFWRLQEPGARPWPGEPLLLFACILLLACIVVTYEQRILIDTKDTSELQWLFWGTWDMNKTIYLLTTLETVVERF